MRLASGYAGDPHLAEDALQEAYWAVSQVRDAQRIENPRAYFCTVLIVRCTACAASWGPRR